MSTTDSHHVLRILGDLDRFLVGVVDPILKDMGIGRDHWQTLRLLEDGRGRPMGEISQSLGIPAASATRVVDVLVSNMLVYRRSDPLDRRRVLVCLSGAGQESFQRITERLREHTAHLLATLDPSERHALVDLLGRLTRVAGMQPYPRDDDPGYAEVHPHPGGE